MHRSIFLLIAAALWPAAATRGAETKSADGEPWNVIFFLVDDWGWTDAGSFGSDLYETPNIDRLAAEGVKFTDGYAACTVCSPTRAAVMTGMYPGRTNVTDWIPGMLANRSKQQRAKYPLLPPPNWTQKLEHRYTTIAEALRGAGYHTMHVGKWHLTPRSDQLSEVRPYYPDRHGFDVNIAGNQWGAPGNYYRPFTRASRRNRGGNQGDADPLSNRTMNFPEDSSGEDYLSDMLTSHMLQQLQQWREDPFFVYFPFYNVHTPIQGRKDLVEYYRPKSSQAQRHTNPQYAAMVGAVDDNIGRVMDKLEQWGVADRTVIVLTGDNGGLDRGGDPTENQPLRAGKGSAYEGGVRVPTIIKWPGAGASGEVCEQPVISVDYYPTLLEITGVEGAPEHNGRVDGVSLVPLLKNPASSLDREAIYWHYPHYHGGGSEPYSAIRAGRWRLVEFQQNGRAELYDLQADIGETRDLSQQMPEKTAQLRDQLHAWREQVGAQMAVPNPDYQRPE